MPRHNNPDRAHGDENEANACGFPRAVPRVTVQRIYEKNESSQGSEQYQGEEVVRVSLFDRDLINRGTDNQGAAYKTTSE